MLMTEVKALLGPATDQNHFSGTTILWYGWYEFYFDENRQLFAIQNDSYNHRDPGSYAFPSERFELDYWLMDGKQRRLKDVLTTCKENDIDAEIASYHGREVLYFDSGVILDFDDEGDWQERELIGMRYFPTQL